MYSDNTVRLIFAIRGGNITQAQEAVAAGGSVNGECDYGSPLTEAIRQQNLPILEWLLQNGADPNVDYGDAIGPLEIALHHPNPPIVRALVYGGAKLKRTARPYYRARMEACLKDVPRS